MILVHEIVMTFVLIFISLGLALSFSTNLYILLYHKIDLLLSGIAKIKNAIILHKSENVSYGLKYSYVEVYLESAFHFVVDQRNTDHWNK